MIKGEYEYLANLAKFNVCAEHGTPLEVAWHDKESSNVLRCGQGHYPDAISKQPSLTEMWKQGEELPGHIKDNIERRERRKAMTQSKQFTDPGTALLPKADLGSGELLVPETVELLVKYAQKYDLDPYRGHVVLMYGKPYITIDGYLYHANKTGQPYGINSRPLTKSERKEYQVPDESHAWLAQVVLPDPDRFFPGLGIVTQEELTEEAKGKEGQKRYPVVAAHPWQMAQKRAEWQALRRAFPIGGERDDTEKTST